MVKKVLTLTVVLFLVFSVSSFAFVSDFEEAEVELVERWSEVTFSFLDGWFARVGPSDSRAIEVFSAYGAETSAESAYEGDYAMGVLFYDTAAADPGSTKWDFNARPGEAGCDHYSSVVEGDTITFHLWIPPRGAIDTQLLIAPYAQYLDWSVFDDSSAIDLDSIYANEGLTEGGWRAFYVVLPDTVGGSDVLSTGIQFEYPDTVNPNDTIFVDFIHSTDLPPGIDIQTGDAGILSLPKASINKLNYEISAASLIHIAVYNTMGQRVKQIVPGAQAAGAYSLNVDLASGVYLYKVTAGKEGKSSKLLKLE
jgi:hypothetical protein